MLQTSGALCFTISGTAQRLLAISQGWGGGVQQFGLGEFAALLYAGPERLFAFTEEEVAALGSPVTVGCGLVQGEGVPLGDPDSGWGGGEGRMWM